MDALFIKGFSKLDQYARLQKISGLTSDPEAFLKDIQNLMHPDPKLQKIMNAISENTLGNFPLPYGIAPNFNINGSVYAIPMVSEESSVVAAASWAARFWFHRGGFNAELVDNLKSGQIYFSWKGKKESLDLIFNAYKPYLFSKISPITERMEKRGGGIMGISLLELTKAGHGQYCMDFRFRTGDSMGANFINTVLEESSKFFELFLKDNYPEKSAYFDRLMCILSNHTPECTVKVNVTAPVSDIETATGIPGLVSRIIQAVRIAENDINRAVTHNKGIYNGIDAVLIATGNDYRAVEAAGHAFASEKGKYSSLSFARIIGDNFEMGMEIPLAIGTVGGLTSLHPLAKWSLDILGKPGAAELMKIVASAGLANHFSAIKSLVTSGIQKGHMKLHLGNILHSLQANEEEKERAIKHFSDKTVSYSEVEKFLKKKM